MKKILFIILLLTTYSFAQEWHFRGKVTIDSLIATDTSTTALQKADSAIYATKFSVDALPTVAETKAFISDSITYANSGVVKITAATSGNPAIDNYVPVLTGDGNWRAEALEYLPIPSLTQSALDLKADNVELQTKLQALESDQAIFKQQISDLQYVNDSLGVRISAITPFYPYPPTEFLATPVSISQANLSWKGGFRNYDAVIIDSSSDGVNYVELARQVGSDSTYSHTGLASNTLTFYYVRFHDSTLALTSNNSNIDTATTFSEATQEETLGNIFVDNTATGNNDGTTWENAYESFADIVWANVEAGDTVFISGGTDSIIYNERLTVPKSGSANNHIVITGSRTAGHNGKVIITSSSSDYHIGTSNMVGYVKFRKLYIRGDSPRIGVYIVRGNDIHLDSLNLTDLGGTGIIAAGNGDGVTIDTDSLFILNTYIRTKANTVTPRQDDCMQLVGAGNVFIDNCILIQGNTNVVNAYNHPDAIQLTTHGNVTISNSYLYNLLEIDGGQCIIAGNSSDGTSTKVYNNIIYHGKRPLGAAIYTGSPQSGATHNWYIYSNTIEDNGERCIEANNANCFVKNNIFYNTVNSFAVRINTVQTDYSRWDNNLFYMPNNTGTYAIRIPSGSLSLAQFVSTSGGGANNITGNPFFSDVANLDYSLESDSDAINVGATLGTPYNVDILGVTRPVGAGYDIGAYEYNP